MYTLGINAAYHDPAACLVKNGQVIAAAEEERFTRIKHGKRPVPFSAYELPFHAIHYCLKEAGITMGEVDHVAYAYNPFLLLGDASGDATIQLPLEPSAHPTPEEWESAWDPLFLSSIVNAPRHLAGGVPHHLQERFLNGKSAEEMPYKWHFVDHHIAHAASAFHASPFSRAAVLTLDGRGERATTFFGLGNGIHLEQLGQVEMPHSLGLLYEQVTDYLGFLHASDEYKVMALASFGKARYLEQFRELVQVKENGCYTIAHPLNFEQRFGPPRRRGEPLEQRHFDIAYALQNVLEESVLQLAEWLHRKTGSDHLCMAGGVALNCVMNARLRDEGPFHAIWVQPAAGDAGTALGAALWVDAEERQLENQEPERGQVHAVTRSFQMDHVFLGPGYEDDEIEAFLQWARLPHSRLHDVAEIAAEMLAQGKVIGWFQGRMEFGPRALGARSILASPLDPEMKEWLNDIKGREDFRPVAPVVLEEEASTWFTSMVDAGTVSPFMLFIYDVRPEKVDQIPAVQHIDGTARIQTVNRAQHPLYYELLRAFQARTGVPVLVNTSFNTRGEPIVCSPRDAVECFYSSPLDALFIGSFLLQKDSVVRGNGQAEAIRQPTAFRQGAGSDQGGQRFV